MRPRKSTWIWIGVLIAAIAAAAILGGTGNDNGCLHLLAVALIWSAAFVLVVRVLANLFRLVIRRLTLRLAFSYFLIGIVPIPLLATLLSLASYMVAHQFMANRLRREMTAVGEAALAADGNLPEIRADADGVIVRSGLSWLHAGEKAPWLSGLARPGFLASEDRLWLAIPAGARSARVLDLSDPDTPGMQRLADLTGYEVAIEMGTAAAEKGGLSIFTHDEAESKRGIHVHTKGGTPASPVRRPANARPAGGGPWGREWIHAFYLETVLNAVEKESHTGRNVAILQATTSPATLSDQLFAQGVAEIGRVFWIIFAVIAGILLLVYLVALAVAFSLVGSIARSVNRLTRAAEAVARGDFSLRIHSKSRDQIGDLARTFDGMADSIQRLLLVTARKERLEAEVAMARTIQHKLLPPAAATLPGFSVLAHFQPVAEIGGDYYDYLPMPDGRTAVALGDVSGHGLPTGLLVAMAKAALSTLLQAGHQSGDLFSRMNDLIHRSTEPRHYMTLCLLAYDAAKRRGTLTNAGQLPPYRISGGRVESLALPAFPLGLFPDKTFPSQEYTFAAGDVVVILSDGLVEAADALDEPFGFERFEAILREEGGNGAESLRNALLAAIAAHTGERPPEDDRTLVILTLE
ncbi:MAG: SpoIIE family protein phosphatase [Acidobacteriota bacterium]